MFVALALIGVSQLIDETEKYKKPAFAHIPIASCKKFCNDDNDCPGSYCMNSPEDKPTSRTDPGVKGRFCCFGSEKPCSDWGKGCDCDCKNQACGFIGQPDEEGETCDPNTQEGRAKCAMRHAGGESCEPTHWTYHNYAKGCCFE